MKKTDTGTRGQGDTVISRHGDAATQRRGDMGTRGSEARWGQATLPDLQIAWSSRFHSLLKGSQAVTECLNFDQLEVGKGGWPR